jgi:hypothetical protein
VNRDKRKVFKMAKKNEKADGADNRAPIEARGADLMAMIANAGAAGLMLTQEEGMDLINSGYAVVDTSVTEGNTAKVTLTDSGKAALASSGNRPTSFEIEDDIAIPTTTARRGRQGGYPFENLEVGQSFHVPTKDGEDASKTAARLQSSVSGARSRFAEETGEMETATRKVYAKNDDGEFIKDEDGKRVVESEEEYERPVTRPTRDFTVKPVDENDPKGPGARVWRTA